MEDLPLGRIAALVPEFAVKNLPLCRTLMMLKWALGPGWTRKREEKFPPLRKDIPFKDHGSPLNCEFQRPHILHILNLREGGVYTWLILYALADFTLKEVFYRKLNGL